MIKGILIVNNHGKARLSRFYSHIDQRKQQQLLRDVFSIISKRSDAVCNFVEMTNSFQDKYRKESVIKSIVNDNNTNNGSSNTNDDNTLSSSSSTNDLVSKQLASDRELASFFDSKVIYRHYATLFFVFLVDGSESELGILDLIQVFVEALDQRFENVCELDIVFHYDEVNYILDEIVMAGMVLETNLTEIMSCVHGMRRYEKISKQQSKKNKTVLKSHV